VVNIIGRSIPVQPQQSGVGSLFETLAAPFMDRNSGLAKQSVTSLNTAKTAEIQRALDAGQVFADLIRSGNVNSADADAAAFLAGKNSKDVGGFVYNNTLRNNAPLAGDAVARSALMRGDNYSSTPMAHGQEIAAAQERQRMQEATALEKARMAPTDVLNPDGSTGFARAGDVVKQGSGYRPVLGYESVKGNVLQSQIPTATPEQLQTLAFGQPGKTVNLITEDGPQIGRATPTGYVNPQTGQPITSKIISVGELNATSAEGLQAPNSARVAAMNRRASTEIALNSIDKITADLQRPDAAAAMGPLGQISTVINNTRSQVEAIFKEFSPGGLAGEVNNPGVPEAVQGMQARIVNNAPLLQRAQQLSISYEKLQSNIMDLAYLLAKTRGPAERLSNQDVEKAERMIGMSLMDPKAAAEVLGGVKLGLIQAHNIYERQGSAMFKYDPQFIPEPGAPQSGAPAPAQPAAPAAPAAEPTATGPNGQKLILRNGQWVPM
jgi:hypothetical protein